MPVQSLLSVTLEVPELEPGVRFYTEAGLIAAVEGDRARFRCAGQDRDCLTLIGGAPAKRLHHITLRADDLAGVALRVDWSAGVRIDTPPGCADEGLWVADPHGMRIHLVDRPADPPPAREEPFAINEPGRIVRAGRSAMRPTASYQAVRPLRLGHVAVFTPSVRSSVAFMTAALGMGLADQAQDVVAFCCARKNSDHHVVAFAHSAAVGFHHVSFQVRDPDEVGRGGLALLERSGRGAWGFGRHTIGSNFFHYIQDPWGSWFEYYADMDHIEDYSLWTPTNYALEDSLASWGPPVPDDFVHNYEADLPSAGG